MSGQSVNPVLFTNRAILDHTRTNKRLSSLPASTKTTQDNIPAVTPTTTGPPLDYHWSTTGPPLDQHWSNTGPEPNCEIRKDKNGSCQKPV